MLCSVITKLSAYRSPSHMKSLRITRAFAPLLIQFALYYITWHPDFHDLQIRGSVLHHLDRIVARNNLSQWTVLHRVDASTRQFHCSDLRREDYTFSSSVRFLFPNSNRGGVMIRKQSRRNASMRKGSLRWARYARERRRSCPI